MQTEHVLSHMASTSTWLRSFLPKSQALGAAGILRTLLGALVGIGSASFVDRVLGTQLDGAYLIAPIGASAVLLFAVPASPLAQPWPVLGGNLISAAIGVMCLQVTSDPNLAAALAVALSICTMSLLGCLHPPGGAVALTAVLGGPAVAEMGFRFLLAPVALNSLVLLMAAVVFNNLAGRPYPHVARIPDANTHATSDPPPAHRVGFTPEDIQAALDELGEPLDVSMDDLNSLFRQVELQALRRMHSPVCCGQIMSRDLISVGAGEPTEKAGELMRAHDLRSLPVLDGRGTLIGSISYAHLITGVPIRSCMQTGLHTATADTPVDSLLPLLCSGTTHEVMITDDKGQLTGLVTTTDALAALYRSRVAALARAE
ncbi:HPP family protein [Pseudoroseomonas globiformis]|uniref:HPP family protein n=1 Tax=Teichococcus globiformis TaxID=2307229 RepID=A0ABV7FZ17_9PROT